MRSVFLAAKDLLVHCLFNHSRGLKHTLRRQTHQLRTIGAASWSIPAGSMAMYFGEVSADSALPCRVEGPRAGTAVRSRLAVLAEDVIGPR
ncbi:hypothetical protein HYG77_38590 (plasmid) [Rhodococcus sp. ZPP]|jgi:hypothetical protein|uniref:hypothetical protein n=1 Tax=Rhodococcus sp. MSC1_016 TaxID=2909266 RepID=UPI001BB68A6B|nr:hypothetical protein [Rhodococcus sp. MSC1_016]QTJ71344.1 hypothetical protein HYG77_38590 [Rhodococcus sp. ZPP]